jgi:hypothetical protein
MIKANCNGESGHEYTQAPTEPMSRTPARVQKLTPTTSEIIDNYKAGTKQYF